MGKKKTLKLIFFFLVSFFANTVIESSAEQNRTKTAKQRNINFVLTNCGGFKLIKGFSFLESFFFPPTEAI